MQRQSNVFEIGGFEPATTNNRMELLGCLEGLRKSLSFQSPIKYYTDSSYVLYGANQWIHGWKKRNWRTAENQPVLNQDLWQQLDRLLQDVPKEQIDWKYCKGHAGIPGNERCDEISVSLSLKKSIFLFNGSAKDYMWDLQTLPPDLPWPQMNSSKTKKVVFSYLSYINGKVYRDTDWKSCEARVKGRSGVQFKKTHSATEEMEVLKSWGLPGSTKFS